MTKKIAIIINLILFVGLITSMLLYYKGFEIITFSWHILNPSPIEWHSIKIDVPNHLIGDSSEDDEFMIYKADEPYEVAIIFRVMKIMINDTFDFIRFYADKKFKVTETKKVNLPIGESIWIKAINEESEPKHHEAVYLLSKPIRISFFGKESNRDILVDVVRNLSN